MMDSAKEMWRPVVGYEVFYEVSNVGNVRSLDRVVNNGRGQYNKKGRMLKQSNTSTGYKKVELAVNGGKKSLKVHRLVAYAFIKEIEGKEVINHKDGNPVNNRVDNLEWCTQSENIRHAIETGLTRSSFRDNKVEIIRDYTIHKLNITQLVNKYRCGRTTVINELENIGIRIRSASEEADKYNINKTELASDFDKGMRNVDIAKKHGTNRGLIGTYKYKHRKGELL